jgi:cytochrome c oxidase cbb3-type subunit 4
LAGIVNFIVEYQAYLYFFLIFTLVLILYGYIFHLYKSERDGTRNYEKYSRIALDDDLDSTPVEKREEKGN